MAGLSINSCFQAAYAFFFSASTAYDARVEKETAISDECRKKEREDRQTRQPAISPF